jgi:hypothetical protein
MCNDNPKMALPINRRVKGSATSRSARSRLLSSKILVKSIGMGGAIEQEQSGKVKCDEEF